MSINAMLLSNSELVDSLLANTHRLCSLRNCDVPNEFRIDQCADTVWELNVKLVKKIDSDFPELTDSHLYGMLIDGEYSSELFCDQLTKLITSLLDSQ